MTTITLDNVTAENVTGLSTVELIDLVYDQMTRVQRKAMHHFTPNEVLLECYDEHEDNNICRDINPRMLALAAELSKRFQPLRAKLTPLEKRRLTRWLKEMDFTRFISYTKDPSSSADFCCDYLCKGLMPLAKRILALLLEGESQQDFDKVLLKYAEKHAQWEKGVAAWRAVKGLTPAPSTAGK